MAQYDSGQGQLQTNALQQTVLLFDDLVADRLAVVGHGFTPPTLKVTSRVVTGILSPNVARPNHHK